MLMLCLDSASKKKTIFLENSIPQPLKDHMQNGEGGQTTGLTGYFANVFIVLLYNLFNRATLQ